MTRQRPTAKLILHQGDGWLEPPRQHHRPRHLCPAVQGPSLSSLAMSVVRNARSRLRCTKPDYWIFNPLPTPACRKMHERVCEQYIFRSLTHYFQCYSFWWNCFHMPMRKRRQKGFQISDFCWSLSSDIMTVKGLSSVKIKCNASLVWDTTVSTNCST